MSEIKLETKMETIKELITETKSDVIIEVKNETRERILTKASELFMRYGVKSITMDEIARETGVSKKTVYQFFTDKDELVFDFCQNHFERSMKEIEEIIKVAQNPLEELIFISEHIKKNHIKTNASLLFDIKKFHVKAWEAWREHKNTCILEQMKDNLRRGIEKGFYREDIDIEILATLRREQIEMAFNPEVFPANKFPLIDIHTQLITHFMRGIVTSKGHKILDKQNAKMNNACFNFFSFKC